MNQNSTILIVDDQLSSREVLRGLLTRPEYTLAFAVSGEEALAKAVELTPDLILLDVMMPDMDGFEVCQRLRTDSLLAEVPIVMVTALDDLKSRIKGIEAGADDFVTKPLNGVELLARVRTTTRLNRYRRLLLERSYRQQAEAEVRRRNWELTLLNRVITTAASTLNVEEALYVACEVLAQAFELPQATAMLLNREQTQFEVKVEYQDLALGLKSANLAEGQIAGQPGSLVEEIPIVGLMSEYLSTSRTPLAIMAEQTDPHLVQVRQLMTKNGFGSLLVAPILMGEQLAGLIELKGTERLSFTEQDLTLAQSVGAAVGQALETILLYQELEHHADALEEVVAARTRELQSERDRTQAILEALGEAVVVADRVGTIQYLNPAAVAMTGFAEAESIGQNWRLWQSSRSGERERDGADEHLVEEILAAVDTGQTWQGEANNKRKDGSCYDALFTVAPLANPADPKQIIGLVSVHSDITPLKEAERLRASHREREKQAALDKLRHTFLSTVNHELRTPLALMFQMLEMLDDSAYLGPLTEQQLDAVMAIRRQAQTLGRMVENLTRVAAFLSKQERVRPVLAQLAPVFDNILPLAEFKARSKEIAVETNIAPNLPFFPLDVKQMEEALTQLLDNAVKFNRSGGKIKINAQADDQWVVVAVSDTGVGIEPEQMAAVWELFEQGADPLRRAQEGLGLGLALARHIIEAHHGKIEIETALGQGSTFTVKLPRHKNANADQAMAGDQEPTAP